MSCLGSPAVSYLERFQPVDFESVSNSSQSFRSSSSVRSNLSNGSILESQETAVNGPTPLMSTRNSYLDMQAEQQLTSLLKSYILYRCSLNDHCFQSDFDETALDALTRMPFIQALQTVEHFSASVSPRIHKRSAYLMGILRGQEAHWERFAVPGAQNVVSVKRKEILNMPAQLRLFIGQCCLQGNCLPSDFTPEVCLSLHSLPMNLALKSVSAFNSNKRIVAGAKGGVINRARFFLRLIQNVTDQNLPNDNAFAMSPTIEPRSPLVPSPTNSYVSENLCRQLSENLCLSPANRSTGMSKRSSSVSTSDCTGDLNLEQLAELDFGIEKTSDRVVSGDMITMQRMLDESLTRERELLKELSMTRDHLMSLKAECMRLRTLVGGYYN